jgi:outer membrane protein OmpA-like peptidoglycan-associated protein
MTEEGNKKKSLIWLFLAAAVAIALFVMNKNGNPEAIDETAQQLEEITGEAVADVEKAGEQVSEEASESVGSVSEAVEDVAKATEEAAEKTAADAKEAISDAGAEAKEVVTSLGEFFKKKLPGDVELNIPENGVESKVIAFIEDSAKPVDKNTWFDFDRVNFETGNTKLTANSAEQLNNIVAILKAYPDVKIKVGGYTDNTGDAAANQKLSGARAAAVAEELTKLGIAKDRLQSEGYGDKFPIASNDTEEGRAKNRRIALRITEK